MIKGKITSIHALVLCCQTPAVSVELLSLHNKWGSVISLPEA